MHIVLFRTHISLVSYFFPFLKHHRCFGNSVVVPAILNSDLCLSHVIANKFIKKSNSFRMRDRVYSMSTLNTFSSSLPPLTHSICFMSSQRPCSPAIMVWCAGSSKGSWESHACLDYTPLRESPAGTQHLSLSAYGTRSYIVFFLKLAETQGRILTLLFHRYHG